MLHYAIERLPESRRKRYLRGRCNRDLGNVRERGSRESSSWAPGAAQKGATMGSELGEPRIIGPKDGEYAGKPGVLHDRFLVNSYETDNRFSVVEHLLPPRVLAAPVHRHHHEDEYSFVLEGTVGVLLGDEERVATAGHLVFKPRSQWHTFWNAGDAPARILEIISPGGFEQAFRDLDALGGELTPEAVSIIGQRYSVDIDFEGTGTVVERHGLAMS